AGRAVCVLGATVRKEIAAGQNPLGVSIRIRNVACEIIGVLSSKGQSIGGSDQDDVIILPLRAVQHRITGNNEVPVIQVSVQSSDITARIRADITNLLR